MIVVGIGASAGGLEALLPFVGHLSPGYKMSYIIAQHLPTHHRSMLVELLSRQTTLDVKEAQDGELILENTIYVAPQNAVLSIDKGGVKLSPLSSEKISRNIIDYCFNSLALAFRDRAIGIVFSGSGSDGTEGLKAIKSAGGITIAEEPGSAKFDSMPKSAIEKAGVDLVLTPTDAALKLQAIAARLDQPESQEYGVEISASVKTLVDRILKETGLDFVNYKNTTITRQVYRRMAILQIQDIDAYVRYTQDNPEELTRLSHNFLVCVTSFFRDESSFNVLKKALRDTLKNKNYGDEIRCWVPGCATGEEAYTIAMLLAEELGPEINRYRVQIYGTDINTDAIHAARKGEYPDIALIGVDEQLRAKYFTEKDQGYVISKPLRDLVIFSRQDLIRNPPFIRLDLISCRNLLIYLNQTQQEQVLKIFHYALLSHGILFLGQAESLWSLSYAFMQLDSNSKLFKKNNSLVIRPDLNSKKLSNFNVTRIESDAAPVYQANKVLGQEMLVKIFAPPSILTTPDGRILEFYKNCEPFIKIKPGKADFNLFSMIDKELKIELKAFCHHALSSHQEVLSPPFTVLQDGKPVCQRMRITPVCNQQNNDELLLISFEKLQPTSLQSGHQDGSGGGLVDLEHELKTARETLQTVTEALEVSVTEWQVLSEEAQTYNEELQSTNEELETSNEELHSINEELSKVNDELTLKTQELGTANDDLKNVLDSIEKTVIVVDEQLQVTQFNESIGNLFASEVPKVDGVSLGSLELIFARNDLTAYTRQVIDSKQSRRLKLRRHDRHYELNIYPYHSRLSENCTGAVLTIKDITNQYLNEQQIRLSASVFEAANEAIVITGQDNRIISVNPAFSKITGFAKEEVIGKNPKVLSSGLQNRQFYRAMWKTLGEEGRWQGEIWNQRKNGEIYIEWLSISVLNDENGQALQYVGIFTDISESFKAQQTIMHQANYDALTRLPNRNLFYDRLQQAMTKSRRTDKLIGVLFIDLDGFKEINDALGHSQGDLVLQHVAERMVKVARESDTFARFGGDEFIVMIPDIESETDVIATTEKILETIQRPILLGEHELNITASIGITIYPNDGKDVETLLKHADNAMYSAKSEGRNAYRFFTAAMHEKVKHQHRIANDIKNAIKFRQFSVFYQPVYDFNSQRMVGAEALIRWQHPSKGFIPPDEFIPVAEKLNLISAIGEFVLDRACRFIAELNSELSCSLSIAVNFSSLQFGPQNCAEKWLDIMKASGVELDKVVVEITESLMMSHQDQYMQQLEMLKQHGIQVALDDFGTGFSSLSYLKNLPFDILKIDKSFIRDILVDPSDASLVESILAIAKNFSLDVIAEGVEEPGQADFLIARECQYAQGYYYGKPVSGEQFRKLIKDSLSES